MRRILISSKIHIKRLLRNSIFPQHTRYRRFAITGHPRTGSTLLHTYLNDHWNLHSYGELLSMQLDSRLAAENLSARQFYNKNFTSPFPRIINAVGFKYFYQYEELSGGQEILDLMLSDPELLFIHLKRRNKLRTAISYQIARATSAWTGSESERLPVELNVEELLHDLVKLESWEKEYDEYLSGRKMLTVYYEDLVAEPQEELHKIQLFLGVEPCRLHSVLHRQHEGPIETYVSNFQEVRSRLNNTRWSIYTGSQSAPEN
ncbi:Stf0 family sulfotransferase [Fulvivirga sedimenti]|uniref:Sulfotransferase n=1 Tax=Fulvivirga sedimenti TaxID=2879465 RepID=A0A9X1HXR8_9BACT|nr:sulfotransferase [Fulvivirga sedimenti]MCA6078687.1 sulfotransferase [Fulvivirga sedimenti]